MIKNQLKFAFRSLKKRKLFSFINITGLTLGLAFAGIIGIYVFEHVQVDRYQPTNLYRTVTAYSSKTVDSKMQTVGRALVPAIAQEIPEVAYVIPMRNAPFTVKQGDDYFFDQIVYAGDRFLDAFNFPLLEGNAHTALEAPYSAVLTKPMAEKYFGSAGNAVGKTLLLSDTIPCTVTGVLNELPASHMAFDVLLSFSTWLNRQGSMDEWFTWDMTCYVSLKPEADVKSATEKISALSMRHNGEQYRSHGYHVAHELEPVRDIYLHSSLPGFNKASGSATQLYIFGAIGIALLILACINFINLTTAYQVERGKEVGIRKTIGASTPSLIRQFMVETLVMVSIAALLAIGVIILLLPFVEAISGQKLSIRILAQPAILIGGLVLVAATTLLAGWYPSLQVSRLLPVASIKGQPQAERGGFTLRRALVVFQFTVSLMLIMGTVIAHRQLNYMSTKELGFNKDEIVVISLNKSPFRDVIENYESIKNQLLQLPGISSVTASSSLPGRTGWNGQLVQPEGFSQDKSITLEVIPSDFDYVKTLGIEIKAGRDFSTAFSTDATNGVLLNETACRLIGWTPEEAVGKVLSTSGMEEGRVIGVMSDYHQHGLQEKIGPVLIFNYSFGYNYIAASVEGGDVKSAISNMEQFWKNRFPGYPFEHFMLDEDLERQYRSENNLASVVTLFSLLTILIAALGLFGLTTFIVVQKRKEIGIRKVLGASVSGIVTLLSKDFVKLVLIAVVIASPIAWWAMNKWLEGFAYRINIEWWMLALAGLSAAVIALLTISFQAIKAALANPVNSLRDE